MIKKIEPCPFCGNKNPEVGIPGQPFHKANIVNIQQLQEEAKNVKRQITGPRVVVTCQRKKCPIWMYVISLKAWNKRAEVRLADVMR